jgi:glucose 1-dehydrogenase
MGGHGERAHRVVEADVAAPGAGGAMVEALVAAWGRLDILVNNAGIQAPTPGEDYDDAALERILAVNVVGAAACARAAIRHFLARPGGGVVVNTSSVHETIPKPGYLAYSLSKGALGNLTRTLALEFADRGIRVNAVGPGAVLTPMNDAWRHDPAARAGVERHIPMGFAATPEALAPVFAFLASDDAAYVTGQTLYADGGLTLYGDFKANWSS